VKVPTVEDDGTLFSVLYGGREAVSDEALESVVGRFPPVVLSAILQIPSFPPYSLSQLTTRMSLPLEMR
jgi:hypothetical protein